MANHKQALKRARQNSKRNARNRALRSALRTTIKRYRALLASSDWEAAQAALPGLHKAIDKAVTKGILHRNAAARHKSRLAGALNKGLAA